MKKKANTHILTIKFNKNKYFISFHFILLDLKVVHCNIINNIMLHYISRGNFFIHNKKKTQKLHTI
jgi:hypothetical protein